MNSVYFPANVVLVLRRIVNVISTLSISNQYILLKQAQADEERTKVSVIKPSGTSLLDFQGQRWPKWDSIRDWDWHKTMKSSLLLSSVNGSEQITGSWQWQGLLSMLTRTEAPIQGDPPPSPPTPPKPRKDCRPALPPSEPATQAPSTFDTIHLLLQNPALYDPLCTPRYPIVLCHGLYGFDTRGSLKFPSMRRHYWSNVLSILRDIVKAEVIVTSVPGTGSIVSRAEILDRQLQHKATGRGINFLAHSMGGLDCRHLISHIKPEVYAPLSLTTISTPHRGSPFMDWCADYIGIGKLREIEAAKASQGFRSTSEKGDSPAKAKDTSFSLSTLPSSFTSFLLSIVDSPAYSNLTTGYLNEVFNPQTPDDPTVKYFSVAGRVGGVNIWHPFWFTKLVLDGTEEKNRSRLRETWEKEESSLDGTPLWAQEREWGNDGLVTVQSARWGEFLGIMEGCDRKPPSYIMIPDVLTYRWSDWEMRGARGIEFGVDLPAIPAIGLGASNAGQSTESGDSWGLPDLGRFVGAWKREQKVQADVVVDMQITGRAEQRKLDRDRDDLIVKSSTDRLSAVVDWLTDQMPSSSRPSGESVTATSDLIDAAGKSGNEHKSLSNSTIQKRMDQEGKARMKNELASKKDLERFYVALSRKLYNEGL
ncbi:hypothetical protein H0H93_014226 [Arthromyces matolae]|nr:hypothetical protein H0H93_014226 [Arthromyces matolae]